MFRFFKQQVTTLVQCFLQLIHDKNNVVNGNIDQKELSLFNIRPRTCQQTALLPPAKQRLVVGEANSAIPSSPE